MKSAPITGDMLRNTKRYGAELAELRNVRCS